MMRLLLFISIVSSIMANKAYDYNRNVMIDPVIEDSIKVICKVDVFFKFPPEVNGYGNRIAYLDIVLLPFKEKVKPKVSQHIRQMYSWYFYSEIYTAIENKLMDNSLVVKSQRETFYFSFLFAPDVTIKKERRSLERQFCSPNTVKGNRYGRQKLVRLLTSDDFKRDMLECFEVSQDDYYQIVYYRTDDYVLVVTRENGKMSTYLRKKDVYYKRLYDEVISSRALPKDTSATDGMNPKIYYINIRKINTDSFVISCHHTDIGILDIDISMPSRTKY